MDGVQPSASGRPQPLGRWRLSGPLNALGEDITALRLAPDINHPAGGGRSEAQTDIFDQNPSQGPMLGTDINGPSRAGSRHKRT